MGCHRPGQVGFIEKEQVGKIQNVSLKRKGTPHTAIPATCKKKRSEELFVPKEQQVKAYANVI